MSETFGRELTPEEIAFLEGDDNEDPYDLEGDTRAAELGLREDEIVTMAALVERAATTQNEKGDLFAKNLQGSLLSRLNAVLRSMDDESTEESIAELQELRTSFLSEAQQMLESVLKDQSSCQSQYLSSLTPMTIKYVGQSFALFFQFLATYCVAKNLAGFTLNELKTGTKEEKLEKVKKMLPHFVSYLRNDYALSRNRARIKQAENLEPATVFIYAFKVLVALKIVGVIDIDTEFKDVGGEDMQILRRAAKRNEGSRKMYFKETVAAVDLAVLFQDVPISNLYTLHNLLYCMFMAETGLRPGSSTGCNLRVNKHAGIALKDLHFSVDDQQQVTVVVDVRHEKTMVDAEEVKHVVVTSRARINHVCAADLLLLYVCAAKYTRESLPVCLERQEVKIREGFEEFPLFTYGHKGMPVPGSSLTKDGHVHDWLAEVTGVPRSFLSARSFRKGYATAIGNSLINNDPNITEHELRQGVISTTMWRSDIVSAYLPDDFRISTLPFQVYGTEMQDEVRSITSNTAGAIFLSDEWKSKRLGPPAVRQMNEVKVRVLEEKTQEATRDVRARIAQFSAATGLSAQQKAELGKAKEEKKTREDTIKAQIESRFAVRFEEVHVKAWNEAKRTIPIQDRFHFARKGGRNVPRLDFEKVWAKFENLFVPTPLLYASHIGFRKQAEVRSRFEDFPASGVQCRFCPSKKKAVLVRTKDEYDDHVSAAHKKHSDKSVCHSNGCGTSFSKEALYRDHFFSQHGWKLRCATCGADGILPSRGEEHIIAQEKKWTAAQKKKEGEEPMPEHVLVPEWELAPFVLPSVISLCECAKIVEFPTHFYCAKEMPVVQSFWDEKIAAALAQQSADKNPITAATEMTACFFKIPAQEVPTCIQSLAKEWKC